MVEAAELRPWPGIHRLAARAQVLNLGHWTVKVALTFP